MQTPVGGLIIEAVPAFVFFLLLLMAPAQREPAAGYEQEITRWRARREAALKADGGWLTVTGLFWLKEGVNTAGSGPKNTIALPPGSAPGRTGTFLLRKGEVRFEAAPGAGVTLNGKPVSSTTLKADVPGPADVLTIGPLSLILLNRGGKYAIRLKDNNSPFRKEFTGLHWYPVKREYRVVATFVPYAQPKTISIPTILGTSEEQQSPGYAEFALDGTTHRLEPVAEGEELFFIFRDLTSGKQTYPAGRFLYSAQPENGRVVLDFNKAYNPPCAFTPYATCPLPPPQNRLRVKIEAGELNYGHH